MQSSLYCNSLSLGMRTNHSHCKCSTIPSGAKPPNSTGELLMIIFTHKYTEFRYIWQDMQGRAKTGSGKKLKENLAAVSVLHNLLPTHLRTHTLLQDAFKIWIYTVYPINYRSCESVWPYNDHQESVRTKTTSRLITVGRNAVTFGVQKNLET